MFKKCEKEFRDYIKDKMVAAKAEIRELLQVNQYNTLINSERCSVVYFDIVEK